MSLGCPYYVRIFGYLRALSPSARWKPLRSEKHLLVRIVRRCVRVALVGIDGLLIQKRHKVFQLGVATILRDQRSEVPVLAQTAIRGASLRCSLNFGRDSNIELFSNKPIRGAPNSAACDISHVTNSASC